MRWSSRWNADPGRDEGGGRNWASRDVSAGAPADMATHLRSLTPGSPSQPAAAPAPGRLRRAADRPASASFLLIRACGEGLTAPDRRSGRGRGRRRRRHAGHAVPRPAGPGRRDRRRPGAGPAVPRRSASRRSSAKSSPASCSGRRSWAGSRRTAYALPPARVRGPLPGAIVAARRDPLHVPGRPGAERRPAPRPRPRHRRHLPRQHRRARSCWAPLLALWLYPRLSAATCRSPASPCSWAWPCRSRPSRCWPASSPTAA